MSLRLRLPLEEVVGVGLNKMGQRDAAWSRETVTHNVAGCDLLMLIHTSLFLILYY